MTKRMLGALAALTVLGLILAAPALAQDCENYSLCSAGGSGTPVTSTTARFTYNGGDGQPGGPFDVDFLSTPVRLGTFNFDANGNFDILVKVPSDAVPGTHTLRAVGQSRFGSQLTVTAAITVVRTGKLTATGLKILPIALLGLGTVLVGGTAVGVAQRQRHRSARPTTAR